ncbi:MAG: hypothetical protein ABW172_14260 [Candidatus Binatia bacterium]|jgi:hypothetical protein
MIFCKIGIMPRIRLSHPIEANSHHFIISCCCLLSVCQAAQRKRLFHAGRACRIQASDTKARHEHIYFASVLGYGGGAIKILAITSPNPDYHLSESQLLRNIIPDDEFVVMGLKKVKLNGIPAVVTTSQWLPESVLHEIDLWFAGKKFTVQLAHADGDVPPWVDFIIESITPL